MDLRNDADHTFSWTTLKRATVNEWTTLKRATVNELNFIGAMA